MTAIRKFNSQQFDLPAPKGEVPTPVKLKCNESSDSHVPNSSSKRRSPILSGSLSSVQASLQGQSDMLSLEMSMKTVEMLALIKGTTPQEAYLLNLTEQMQEEERERAKNAAAQASTEESTTVRRRSFHSPLRLHNPSSLNDEDKEEYAVGTGFDRSIDSDSDSDDSLTDECYFGENGYDEGKDNDDDNGDEGIFEIEM